MMRFKGLLALVLVLCAGAVPASAQQTGAISGKVVDTSNAVLPGVTVEARSDVLPSPRVTVTEGNGEYRLPALPPGKYTLTFTLSGMQTVTAEAEVQLGQDTNADITMGLGGVTETVEVVATTSLVERGTTEIKSGISNEQILALPVGQEYRDLIRLIPAVQFTQDSIRGPSAGGSGQDNVYMFDGVNVTLPLFGTLASEPASHDIAQVTTLKGGARAVDFERSAGFSIDTVSKSGTNALHGMAQFQLQTPGFAAEPEATLSKYDQTRSWIAANVGGPLYPNKMFFFGLYYRPEASRDLRSNAYGELPDYNSTRNEGFGKVTYTPTSSILLNGSYRDSKREETSDLFGQFSSGTSGTGNESRQRIAIGEASWVIDNRSLFTAKYTNFSLETLGRPDFVSNASVDTTLGTTIDLNALDTLGRFTVPSPLAGNAAQNAFVAPLIQRYGYDSNGVRAGGGIVGYVS